MTSKQLKLLDDGEIVEAHGKNIEALHFSRKNREDILRMFDGQLPMSIMEAKKATRGKKDLGTGTYAITSNVKQGSELEKIFDVSGQSCRSGALSVFPQNIGKAVLLLYSDPGDIVIDPFVGHNSRMELCLTNGRKYVGGDISLPFVQFTHSRAEELKNTYPSNNLLCLCDSRSLPIADAIGNFTLSSPPYYNLEDYGNEKEQLGKLGTYDDFLTGLLQVAKENYCVLKNNSYCVWFVNDFRLKGIFYKYHMDVTEVMSAAGFTLHDIMIVDLGYPIRAAFASQIVKQKILPKKHEYGLIFRKN